MLVSEDETDQIPQAEAVDDQKAQSSDFVGEKHSCHSAVLVRKVIEQDPYATDAFCREH
jgi:hypothetical protein